MRTEYGILRFVQKRQVNAVTDFYLASHAEQSVLLICLFLSLITALFYLIASCDKAQSKFNIFLNSGLFLFLFILLSVLGGVFRKSEQGLINEAVLPLPMWLLWCIAVTSNILLICETVVWYRKRGNNLSRRSVKQAIDTLPSAICYFAPSGAVKLCNLQMHRLFRTLAQSDMQTLDELQEALLECDAKNGVIRLSDVRQTYLFPNGKVWRYSQAEVAASDGVVYTEAIFFDVTELYEKNLKLKEQTKQLEKISRDLRLLSDNVLTLTKEKELLAAKTRLHDQMSAGIIAMRRILQQEQMTEETAGAVRLFQKAVSAIKNDNEYPLERTELAEFMRDADTIGVKVELSGELPEQQELYSVFVIAMRECLTNSVRHADATMLKVDIQQNGNAVSMCITNNGKPPKSNVTPKGGLLNLYRNIINLGGTMEVRSSPIFALILTVPKPKEGTE